jgi:sterol desaturase/sphingolipid hydroxylase (fatty acid hydroxylase superfamily)
MERLLDALPIAIYLAGIAIEYRWPARVYPTRRWWKTTCVAFSLGIGAMALAWRALLSAAIDGHHLVDGSALGAWQVPVGVASVTFVTYWAHRMVFHRSDFAFRWIHQLHHSAERVDVFGANFGHPFQALCQGLIIASMYELVFGLTHTGASLATATLVFMNTYQHVNIRTPRWTGYLIQRPESHNIHHQRGVHAFNYSDLPLWDMLFGTYRNPHELVSIEAGYYDNASMKVGAMLRGRDISASP